MGKKIILNEEQLKAMLSVMAGDDVISKKTYSVNPQQVLIVKKFLDDNYDRGIKLITGNNGLPYQAQIIRVKSPINPGEYLEDNDMFKDDFLELLIDQFKNMFTDKEQRRKFLKQTLEDWYDGKITNYGGLSKNCLREWQERPIPGYNQYYRMKPDYRFNYGVYKAHAVSELLNTVRGKNYLIWAYYNMAFTDYNEDIINALNIDPIEKPGTNEELGKTMIEKYMSSLTPEELESVKYDAMAHRSTHIGRTNKKIKSTNVRTSRRDGIENFKGKLAWKNQGHE